MHFLTLYKIAPAKLKKNKRRQKRRRLFGGEGGIWTRATFNSTTPLAGEPLQPLGYFSVTELKRLLLKPLNHNTKTMSCQKK